MEMMELVFIGYELVLLRYFDRVIVQVLGIIIITIQR